MIEKMILSGLVFVEDYTRQVLPYLKEDYFKDDSDRLVLSKIQAFLDKYNKMPTRDVLAIDVTNTTGLSQRIHDEAIATISEMSVPECETEWLVDQTELFCKDRSLYNALREAIKIVDDNKEQGAARGAIPKLLQDALGVSFDNTIGHDFLEDYQERFEFYHNIEEKLPFDIEFLNKITKGGLARKTLNILMAGVNVGKSLAMCHMAAAHMMAGKNVLYITMEMSQERIAERIDANLLDVPLDMLEAMPFDRYSKKMEKLKEKCVGKLVVKEFPTSTAGSGHFRHLLNELETKKNFKADVIYIDYLNICASSRIKMGANVNSYTYIKTIAEELRGLAVEFNVPIVSATQTTRSGSTNSDVGMEDTAESFGLPATCDLMLAIIATDELLQLNQYMVKQLKNRYADKSKWTKFTIGVDKSKMRLYDVEQGAQDDIIRDTQTQPSQSTNYGIVGSKKTTTSPSRFSSLEV